MRLGLVGCGRLAERGHVPALRRAPEVTLCAVADPALERCRATFPGLPAFGTLDEMLAAGIAEAVVIASPAEWHLPGARRCAESGIPALVEKPPAPDAPSAAALRKLDPAPWIAFNRRFFPGLPELRGSIPSSGPIEMDLSFEYPRGEWRAWEARYDALLDVAPHMIDLVAWIAGQGVKSVSAPSLDDRTARLELELEDGRAVIRCDAAASYRESVIVRRGTFGGAWESPRGMSREIMLRLRHGARTNAFVVSLRRELAAFAGAVRGESSGELATAADGLRVMEVIDGARRSAAAGGAAEAV